MTSRLQSKFSHDSRDQHEVINIVHTQPLTIVHISSVTYIKSDHSPHIKLNRTTNGILSNRVITVTTIGDFESA